MLLYNKTLGVNIRILSFLCLGKGMPLVPFIKVDIIVIIKSFLEVLEYKYLINRIRLSYVKQDYIAFFFSFGLNCSVRKYQ